MPPRSQHTAQAADVVIDGDQYMLDGEIKVETVPVQPGEDEQEFERRLQNFARGWGESKFASAGGYDYADCGNLHRIGAWLPGAAVTDRTDGTAPTGPVSFAEWWDGTAANRRLVIVSPRYIYEVDSAGTVVRTDLGVAFTLARGMTKAVRYRTSGMTTPKMFVARPSSTVTDYMVRRTGAGAWAVSGNNKYAAAIGNAKDSTGDDVLWRVDENGKLNASLGDNDPDTGASWAGELVDAGESSIKVVDLGQQAQAVVMAREDGVWTFDNVGRAIPITKGIEQTPDPENGRWMKDFNGDMLVPTVQALLWVSGLEWQPAGPVSSNPDARHLRGREVAVSAQAGRYVYAAVNLSTASYIFLGEPRQGGQTGRGPLVWHGPVASLSNASGRRVTDLWASTIFGTKLWIGYRTDAGTAGGWATIDLNADFSPKTDLATGYIYMPDGILDMNGAGIMKDLRKVEFVSPGDTPFSATNSWTLEVDNGAGYTAVDGGAVTAGTYAERYFTTEMAGTRFKGVRLKWSGNTGAAELEAAIVRGTMRAEKTDQYELTLVLRDSPRLATGARRPTTAATMESDLRALAASGRKTVVTLGRDSFSGRVTYVSPVTTRTGKNGVPEGLVTVRVRRIKLA